MNLYKFYSNPEELNGYEDRIYYVPRLAFEALEENPNREDKNRLEDGITKNPKYAFIYADSVLHAPFPKGEDAIAKSGYYSYWYAREILKGPFPKGEDVIAKDAERSCRYAVYILKGPFPKGEDVMRQNISVWDKYRQFLKGLK